MNSLLADLRYALRMLLKSPGFTATAVIALAVGIGVQTAVFSVTNAILLRSLPYQRPGELVWISKVEPQFGIGGLTAGAYLDFREQSETFAGLAAYSEEEFTLSGTDDPQRVVCGEVSAALFPLLGVEPLLGRTFLSERGDQRGYGKDREEGHRVHPRDAAAAHRHPEKGRQRAGELLPARRRPT